MNHGVPELLLATPAVRESEDQAERLRDLVESLLVKNQQLQQALESRIVIEQAKGVLAERYRMSVDDAFELLRRSARSHRIRLHTLATAVVASRETPTEIRGPREAA